MQNLSSSHQLFFSAFLANFCSHPLHLLKLWMSLLMRKKIPGLNIFCFIFLIFFDEGKTLHTPMLYCYFTWLSHYFILQIGLNSAFLLFFALFASWFSNRCMLWSRLFIIMLSTSSPSFPVLATMYYDYLFFYISLYLFVCDGNISKFFIPTPWLI